MKEGGYDEERASTRKVNTIGMWDRMINLGDDSLSGSTN